MKYHGYKALTAGLQADTYLEAFDIQKQKIGYSDMNIDSVTEALVSQTESNSSVFLIVSHSIHLLSPSLYGHKVRELGCDIDPYVRLASSIGMLKLHPP